MGSSAKDEYTAFLEKVRRTVYFDNMSPQVTEPVLRSALDQFATVKSVKFIPNYLEPRNVPQCALVELDSAKKAREVISMIEQYPFMMSGMPRPVRARPAKVEMFDDRPAKPGNRRLSCISEVKPGDPDFEVAQELKCLTRKHAAEAAFLLEQQLQDEEKLARQHEDTLKLHHKKFKVIHSIVGDGTAHRLARHYNMPISDDSDRKFL